MYGNSFLKQFFVSKIKNNMFAFFLFFEKKNKNNSKNNNNNNFHIVHKKQGVFGFFFQTYFML